MNFIKNKIIYVLGALFFIITLTASVLIWRFGLIPINYYVADNIKLHLKFTEINKNIERLRTKTRLIIYYEKAKPLNYRHKLKQALNKTKILVEKIDSEYKKAAAFIKKTAPYANYNPEIVKTFRKSYFQWETINKPIFKRFIKYPGYVAPKIAYGLFSKYALSLSSSVLPSKTLVEEALSHFKHIIGAYLFVFILGTVVIIFVGILFIYYFGKFFNAVRESEKRYFQIFKSNSAPILRLNIETGGIEDVNYSAVNFYGYSEPELKNMNISQIDPFISEEAKRKFWAKLKNSGGGVISVKHRLKSGEIRDVDIYATRLNIDGRPCYIDIVYDVTERKMLEDRVKENEALFRAIAENMINGIIIYREKIVYANNAAENITGYTEEEMLSFHIWDIYSPVENNEKSMIKEIAGRRLKGEKFDTTSYELKAVKKDGKELWLLIYANTILYKGDWSGLVTFTDITELIGLRKQLELEKELYKNLSIEDALTGIFNRRKFESSLEDSMKLAFRYKRPLSLVMFDIDRFKEVNDTFGHQAGDSVLRELTQLVGTALRDTDIIARYGGEEFMVIMPETDIRGANDIAERIRKTVENHTFKYAPSITISLGAGMYADGEAPDSFVKRADDAMYKAKKSGRNRVEVLL
ncbi:MAG: sensor domain-containing diguanylate cyclase [bacterium]